MKRLLSILLMVMIISPIGNVYAEDKLNINIPDNIKIPENAGEISIPEDGGKIWLRNFTVFEIATKFPETELVTFLRNLGANITLNIKESNKKIEVLYNGLKVGEFNYTDDYIEYDDRSKIVALESDLENVELMNFSSASIMEAMFNLMGSEYEEFFNRFYNDENLNTENMYKYSTYDEYGFEYETEYYEDDHVTATYMTYFKMSLNPNKVAKLTHFSYTGEPPVINDYVCTECIINENKPTLEIKKTSENSVTIGTKIEGITSISEKYYKVYCNIYRSTSEDGEYEKINKNLIDCIKLEEFVDKDLESGKTYYYKGQLVDKEDDSIKGEFSSPISIKTKEVKKEQTKIENPKTGLKEAPIVIVFSVVLVGFGAIKYFNKKSNFDM